MNIPVEVAYLPVKRLALENVSIDSAFAYPRGVLVRLTEPDSGSVAATGDKVTVKVIALAGVSSLHTAIEVREDG